MAVFLYCIKLDWEVGVGDLCEFHQLLFLPISKPPVSIRLATLHFQQKPASLLIPAHELLQRFLKAS